MKTLYFILSGLALTFMQVIAQDFTEVFKAVASDRAASDFFGNSVSISGNYAIVGAPSEDEDAGGGNTLNGAGSVYIFERDGNGDWNEVQKIVASDRAVEDYFGYSVCISGTYAIVGSLIEDEDAGGGNTLNEAGSAYIFERDGSGNWNEVQKIVASDREEGDKFAYSVSISGNYVLVGAAWEDEDAGGGNTRDEAGSAYIFERDGSGNWNEVQKIVASDRKQEDIFAYSVSISGNYVLVGAYCEDEDAGGGNTLDGAGSAYIFERDGSGNWNEVQKIVAPDRAVNDFFGHSVSISGNYAIVGAYLEDEDAEGGNTLFQAGSAYIFERDGSGNWNELQKIVAHDRAVEDIFGTSVSISGNYAIVGAYIEDEDAEGGNTLDGAGSAYIFERDGSGNWNEVQKIVAPDRAAEDHFSYSVCISGNYVLIGADAEDEDAEGGNTLNYAGSAYIFESCIPDTTSDPRNVIDNAGFEACIFDPWDLYYAWNLDAIATYQLIGGTCIVTPSHLALSPENWHIQLIQAFSAAQLGKLEAGEVYNLRFDAWSEADNRDCHIYFGMNESPWSTFLDENILLNSGTETYSFDFTLGTVYSSMKLSFDIGTETTWAGFDNVMLMKKSELGIESEEINTTKIWPNPASDYLHVVAENGSGIRLYNSLCIAVREETLINGFAQLDVSDLTKGMYLVEIKNGDTITMNKVIVE